MRVACNRFWFDLFSYHYKNNLVVSHNVYGNDKKEQTNIHIGYKVIHATKW